MVAGLVTDLLEQLGSFTAQQALQELQLPVGVDDEVERLQHNLAMVQAMLNAVEERTLTEPDVVTAWYDQLKDAYYMMDDLLDIWNTARIKSEIQKEEEAEKPADINTLAVRKTVCSFIPSSSCCFNLPMHRDVGGKIKTLNEILDRILNDMEKYGIDLNRQPGVVDRPITNLMDGNGVYGTGWQREEILDSLFQISSEEINPLVISVVGMGSAGKSTLARLVYNDKRVQSHFDEIMWVCVSDPFDQCKVAKAIIESIQGQSPGITELQSLLDCIFDLIVGKRFFLVLDDVWTENPTLWKPFLNTLKWGAQGSRILVTTRKERVAYVMESRDIFNINVLDDDHSWWFFCSIAFSMQSRQLFIQFSEETVKFREEIVRRLKGLPLAIKILGSLMQFKS